MSVAKIKINLGKFKKDRIKNELKGHLKIRNIINR